MTTFSAFEGRMWLTLARFANRRAWPERRPFKDRAWCRIAAIFYRLHGNRRNYAP
jgi:hypothetical protein